LYASSHEFDIEREPAGADRVDPGNVAGIEELSHQVLATGGVTTPIVGKNHQAPIASRRSLVVPDQNYSLGVANSRAALFHRAA
jgi:hypothetical protein